MSIKPQPCKIKGCKSDQVHHHYIDGRRTTASLLCGIAEGYSCNRNEGESEPFSPRPSRKFLTAEVARLSAELADVHDEVADKKDRLARAELQAESDALVIASLGRQIAAKVEPEPVVVMVTPYAGVRDSVTVSINGDYCTGMVFQHDYRPADMRFHACAAQPVGSSHHPTQAEAVAAIVAAWKASR